MTFEEYQEGTATTAVYPNQRKLGGLVYTILGLNGEAGELSNKIKKLLRDDGLTFSSNLSEMNPDKLQELRLELSDCLWYISQVSLELDISLDFIAEANLAKLAKRKEMGTLQG